MRVRGPVRNHAHIASNPDLTILSAYTGWKPASLFSLSTGAIHDKRRWSLVMIPHRFAPAARVLSASRIDTGAHLR